MLDAKGMPHRKRSRPGGRILRRGRKRRTSGSGPFSPGPGRKRGILPVGSGTARRTQRRPFLCQVRNLPMPMHPGTGVRRHPLVCWRSQSFTILQTVLPTLGASSVQRTCTNPETESAGETPRPVPGGCRLPDGQRSRIPASTARLKGDGMKAAKGSGHCGCTASSLGTRQANITCERPSAWA
jgi:hypothetical protein